MVMQNLKALLSTEEELVFMQLLFSSSSAIKGQNYGLKRKEVEKMLNIKNDETAFYSFINRLNQAIARYFKIKMFSQIQSYSDKPSSAKSFSFSFL